MTNELEKLSLRISKCRVCRDRPHGDPLPHEPRPVAVLSSKAKVRIIGQAPGVRVHKSGRPFTDPSGDRLREWMGIDEATFYDPDRLAITPMGFCFPGLDGKGGDLPPRRECPALWQAEVSGAMPQVELVILIGMYAQRYYLGDKAKKTLTATVANWKAITTTTSSPVFLPMPHPSWRNNGWIRKNPWFSKELLPFLKKKIEVLL